MQERKAWSINGILGIGLIIVLLALGAFGIYQQYFALGIVLILIAGILISGITIVQPNQSIVVIFFGEIYGNSTSGRHFGNCTIFCTQNNFFKSS